MRKKVDKALEGLKSRRVELLLKRDAIENQLRMLNIEIDNYKPATPLPTDEALIDMMQKVKRLWYQLPGKSNVVSPICQPASVIAERIAKVYAIKDINIRLVTRACKALFGDSICMKKDNKTVRGYRVIEHSSRA